MDFLTSKIKQMYFKYLAAAFGSALISSVYGVVIETIINWEFPVSISLILP